MPDDPWFDEIDPMLELYMYESWCCDLEEKNELARSHAILNGAFSNFEMAQKMIDEDNDSGTHSSSEEDFEKSFEMVIADRKKEEENKKEQRVSRRRMRRMVLEE